MKLEDLPDDFTPADFRKLDRESLDKIPFTRKKWLCQCKGCSNGTRIRDYGLTDFNPRGIWAMLDRNSKNAFKNPGDYWMGPNNIWFCGKHWAIVKKLEKRFDFEHIRRRLLDEEKMVIVDLPGAEGLGIVKQIEKVNKN